MFQDVGLWNTGTVSVTGLAEPEESPALFVTEGVLPMLGAQPMLGRLFTKTDDSPGTPETVILTAGYWRSKFGADPSVIGRTVMLDSRPREIIGVLPDSFRFLDRKVSLVVPYRFDRSKVFLGQFSFSAIARLKPGTTVQQANADLARMIPISLAKFPPFPGGSVKMFEEARITPAVALAEGRPGRRRPQGALGADGHARPGAADRVRERRQPAAGPIRVAAAGAGDSLRARRRLGPDCP